ncbi:MAG: BMP family protein [Armatimonadetes bacterium]|nr:BMP family protein [Armatimonadota bacterium]
MKAFTVLCAALFALVLGCGTPQTSGGPATAGNDEGFKVALLTPGPVSDAGWSAMAYRGLQAIEKECGATVNNQQATDAQIKDSMRSYAQKGYKLVIGHGFEYNAIGNEVAKDFPGTVFVSSSGGETSPNAGAFRFQLEEGFYLAGMTAGLMSKTGKVAMIGGPDVPSIRSTFKAFKAGAEAAKPGITVLEAFTGKNDDVTAANQATMAALGQGADFVIHQANAAAQGVFEACKSKGVWAFGSNADQNDNPSGIVLASAVIVAEPAFVGLAKRVKDGTYKGEIESIGMDKGAIDYVWNPKLKDKVPADVAAKVEAARSDIKSGKLKVPMDTF